MPTASMVPAPSTPSTNGNRRSIRGWPCEAHRSAWLSEDAASAIRTWPAAGSGRTSSWSAAPAGPSVAVMAIARMAGNRSRAGRRGRGATSGPTGIVRLPHARREDPVRVSGMRLGPAQVAWPLPVVQRVGLHGRGGGAARRAPRRRGGGHRRAPPAAPGRGRGGTPRSAAHRHRRVRSGARRRARPGLAGADRRRPGHRQVDAHHDGAGAARDAAPGAARVR